jgi:pre-rRNA-processing protein TSR1
MGRPHILAEDVDFTPTTSGMEEGAEQKGILKVTGVIRGAPLSADRLVYLQNWGDFAIGRIIAAPRRLRGPLGDGSMEVEDKVLSEPGPDKDDLIESNEVDDMGNEQTWPTEDEMREKGSNAMDGDVPDALEGTTPKAVRRVPKGTSAYQAAWLLEDEDIDSDGDGSEGSDDDTGDTGTNKAAFKFENMSVDGGESNKDVEVEEREEYEDVAEEEQSSKAVAFEDIDMEEEKRQ